jgi:hypothetical protein
MLIVCTLACNEKWKAYILMLTTGDSLVADPISNAVFMTLVCTYICTDAYRGLIFKTIPDNLQFFAIFFSVGFFNATRVVLINIEGV